LPRPRHRSSSPARAHRSPDRLTGTSKSGKLYERGGRDVLRGLGGKDQLDDGVVGDRLDDDISAVSGARTRSTADPASTG
jgi:hypothetical protein